MKFPHCTTLYSRVWTERNTLCFVFFSPHSLRTSYIYVLSYVPPFSDFFSLFHTVYEQFCLLLLVYTFSFTVFDHAFRNINRRSTSHLNGRSFTHSLNRSCKERWNSKVKICETLPWHLIFNWVNSEKLKFITKVEK
jgi:hypothetical protein